jgi:hypothetical protein
MKGLALVGAILGLLLHLGGCKKDPVGPPPPKNPREYTWTVDTLAYPGSHQTLMRNVWGSSSSNIYICGWNDRGYGRMYHFNGQLWTNVRLLVTEGGPLTRVGYFTGVAGFSANDLYAAGDVGPQFEPFLVHFNGSQWREINVPNGKGLQSIWGRSPSEIWIGGREGYLAHYNGSQFIPDSLPYTFLNDTTQNPQITQITGNTTITYLILGNAPDTLFFPIYYLYEHANSKWVVRDSSYDFARVFLSPSGKLYRYGVGGVQQQMGDSWMPILSDLATVGMGADADNNMYAAGYYGVPSTGREAFIIGTTSGFPMKTLVLHGK